MITLDDIKAARAYPGHRGIAIFSKEPTCHEVIVCGVRVGGASSLTGALWVAEIEQKRIKPHFPIVRVRPRNRVFELRGAH